MKSTTSPLVFPPETLSKKITMDLPRVSLKPIANTRSNTLYEQPSQSSTSNPKPEIKKQTPVILKHTEKVNTPPSRSTLQNELLNNLKNKSQNEKSSSVIVPVKVYSYARYIPEPIKKAQIKRKQAKLARQKFLVNACVSILLGLSIFGLGASLLANRGAIIWHSPEIAGANEIVTNTPQTPEDPGYKDWVIAQTGSYANPSDDLDNDGLTNQEEFMLNTKVNSAHTCNPDTSDGQLVLSLIDPATCKSIDLNDDKEIAKFSKIINISNIQDSFLQKIVTEESSTIKTVDQNDLLALFNVSSYSDLQKITPDTIKSNLELNQSKVKYLNLINKIDVYVNANRSVEPYDRDYEPPVPPAVYLQTSLKYNVPLKYVLAIARTESRFGTDRYTKSGNLTRPGEYKNVYSIGLTDGGSNLGFGSWEAGVERFGEWYKYLQDKGVSDCRKWRIFNPNGDYCAKIESLANEIQSYLDK